LPVDITNLVSIVFKLFQKRGTGTPLDSPFLQWEIVGDGACDKLSPVGKMLACNGAFARVAYYL
jgi:hypothetical protein